MLNENKTIYNIVTVVHVMSALSITLCLVSSFTFPFIRSNRNELYFSVSVRPGQRQRRNGNGSADTIT